MNIQAVSGRSLAYLGDALWSLLVRKELIEEGFNKGEQLQKESIRYVSAKAQASFYEKLHEEGFWTEEEEATYRRARNDHRGSTPKNTHPQTYRMSTGFEAILGGLYLEEKEERIREIWDKIRTLA